MNRFIRKISFYYSLFFIYLKSKFTLKESFQVVSSDLMKSYSSKSLTAFFWVPTRTAGADVTVYSVVPELERLVNQLKLPWRILVSDRLPRDFVDFLICFKAIPPEFRSYAKNKVLLICDQADVFWSSIDRFDYVVGTSSAPFCSLLSKKNPRTFFISESETESTLSFGKENLRIPMHQKTGIFWHGGSYSLDALYNLRRELETFALQHAATLFIVSGTQPERIEQWGQLKVVFYPWSIGRLRFAANQSRLAILPAKSGLRSNFLKPASRVRLSYALGVPAIGDGRVPDVHTFMAHFGGPVANSERQWRIEMLNLWNSSRLASLATDGFTVVQNHYQSERTAKQWINFLDKSQ